MAKDIVNFNAGPAGLPRAALERARAEFIDVEGSGISIIEHSHRGGVYEAIHNEAIKLARELLSVPDTHEIILLQGGASQCFATVPMNLLLPDQSADYVITGAWSKKALSEAKLIGTAKTAWNGEVGGQFPRVPAEAELKLDPQAAYVHITSNNTIEGTQYHSFPNTGSVALIADMSSDIFWRAFDVSKFGLIYAGAQKNVGPSGLVLMILQRSLLERASAKIPVIFQFKTHVESNSLYNTPPTFSIYLMRNVLADLKQTGGLAAMERKNREKARVIYSAIDGSGGFYACPVEVGARSVMNIVFRLPTEALEKQFLAESEKQEMIGLKGHRSVGGCRASTYNAVSIEGARRLADLMNDFAKRNG